MMNENRPMTDIPEEYADTSRSGVQLPVCDRTVTADFSGDFSLPDYQPEIKRLLRINTSVLPPARYLAGDSLEMGGTVDHYVLYTGHDNRLYCAPLSSDYRLAVPLDGASRAGGTPNLTASAVNLVPEMVTGRVTAPRRLNIKSRLRARVKAYEECVPEEGMSALMPGSVERLTETVNACRLVQGVGELLPLQDDMILSPEESDMRVVCAEGQVMVNEAVAGNGTVNCRGEVTLKLTMCPMETLEMLENSTVPTLSEDDYRPARDMSDLSHDTMSAVPMPVVMTRKIPFAQAVELEGVAPGWDACAHGICSDISVEIEEGHLHTDLGVVLEAFAQKNVPVTYTRDLFSTRAKTECRYTDYVAEEAVRCLNGNFTLSDSMTLSDAGIAPDARVADVTALAFPEALTVDRGRCVLTGRCRCHFLLLRDGEYNSAEIEWPFRYETDPLPEGMEPEFDGTVRAVTCRARMDGERVGVDAELSVMLRLTAKRPFTALSDATFGEEVTRRRGEYVICFPSSTDTLWSVAKRYNAPLSALCAANGLSSPSSPDDTRSIEGAGYLIV